ncbi:MAG: BREX system P-loop protein BrxC, partial [Actinomycetota bacterium]
MRIHQKTLAELWAPQPSHLFQGAKAFKAGLVFGGKTIEEGDLAVHVTLSDPERFGDQAEQARERSRSEKDAVFWVGEIDENFARDVEELHRSDEMLSRRSHGTQGRSEATLAAEERRRRQRSQEEVRRRLKDALLSGSVYFRGNDRSPPEGTRELKPAVEQLLERVLPEVFNRFEDGAARVKLKDLEALLSAENLRGLPSVFSELQLVTTQSGQDAFNTESGPLAELLARIRNRADYGDPTSGKSLAEDFAREPYGWDFEVVRLMAASLLRAGQVEMRSQNQTIESARTLEAKNVLTNNNRFRQATFRPRSGGPDATELVDASGHFERIFGKAVRDLEAGSIAMELRAEMGPIGDRLRQMMVRLATESLPGRETLARAEKLASELQSVTDSQA